MNEWANAGAMVILAGVVSLATAGCAGQQNRAETVEQLFVARESCPSDRVSVVAVARPDWLTPDAPPPPPPPPPPEVAADPERAKVYRSEHPEPTAVDRYADHHFFEATGCGHVDLYMCDVPATRHIPNGRSVYWTCEPMKAPDPSASLPQKGSSTSP